MLSHTSRNVQSWHGRMLFLQSRRRQVRRKGQTNTADRDCHIQVRRPASSFGVHCALQVESLHKPLHRIFQRGPITPTVADNRTRNRLILRRPAGERPTVTAEAAGSSPVVPAIFFKHLREIWFPGVGTERNNKKIHLPPPATAV